MSVIDITKENIKEEDVKIFYQELMGEAILEIKNNEDYKKCSDIIINCELYCVAVSILVSYIIFIILIPIIRKNKNTIGQVVMGNQKSIFWCSMAWNWCPWR